MERVKRWEWNAGCMAHGAGRWRVALSAERRAQDAVRMAYGQGDGSGRKGRERKRLAQNTKRG